MANIPLDLDLDFDFDEAEAIKLAERREKSLPRYLGDDYEVIDTFHLDIYAERYTDAILIAPPVLQRVMLKFQIEQELHEEYLPKPRPMWENVRSSFWSEYYKAIKEDRIMEVKNIISGVCTSRHFINSILKSKNACAWVFRPLPDFFAERDKALKKALERIQEILDLPMYDKKGNVDTKVANLLVKTIKMVEDRVEGSIINRNENKSLSVKITNQPKDLAALEAEIKELEHRTSSGARIPEVLPADKLVGRS